MYHSYANNPQRGRSRDGLCIIVILSFLAAMALGQPMVTPVKLQGLIFDFTSSPPLAPTSDWENLTGAQISIDPANWDLVLFTTDPQSTLFSAFPIPGEAGSSGSLQYPPNAFHFWTSVHDNGNNSGALAGNLTVPSGALSVQGGLPATQGMLYAGSWENTFWQDGSINTCVSADPTQICNPTDMIAPLYAWSDLAGGDAQACRPIQAANLPQGRFIVLIQRGGCLYSDKARNAALAGAIAYIVYDSTASGDLPCMRTPGASIPGMHISADSGAAVLDQLSQNSGSVTVVLHATNIQGSVSGAYTLAGDGTLATVNLRVQISNYYDSEFTGSATMGLDGDAAPAFGYPASGHMPARIRAEKPARREHTNLAHYR